MYCEPETIASKFNCYFSNVDKNLSNNIPMSNKLFTDFLNDGASNEVFYLSPVVENDFWDLINGFDQTSPGYVNIPSNLIKSTLDYIIVNDDFCWAASPSLNISCDGRPKGGLAIFYRITFKVIYLIVNLCYGLYN